MSNKPYSPSNLTRGDFLKALGGSSVALAAGGLLPDIAQAMTKMPTRPIPATGERIPVLGLGTSRVFNWAMSTEARAPLKEVIKLHFAAGGTMIDTAPLYGKSEIVVGDLLRELGATQKTFIATKVRTDDREEGIKSLNRSFRRLGKTPLDLMQVHSLRGWETFLPILREWKAAGKIRYIGITHSRTSRHDDVLEVISKEKMDFLQINYSVLQRNADKRILPMAADKGLAVLINKPFNKAKMFRKVKGKPLPPWAADFDCKSWGQFFLKFSLSHPAVTCVLAATGKAKHMKNNIGTGMGRLPTVKERQKMIVYWESL